MTDYDHLHLISDSTGDTVTALAKAALSQFKELHLIEHHWTLIRRDDQLEKVLSVIKEQPGLVLFTLVKPEHQKRLRSFCEEYHIPYQPVLKPIVDKISQVWDIEAIKSPGQQHLLDDKYFFRIEAVEFALDHDDGKLIENYHQADIVLLGVSRTSKTPTSMYLANKGLKVANYPVVSHMDIPKSLLSLDAPLIIGLTQDPDVLVHVRKNRTTGVNPLLKNDYIDYDLVKDELIKTNKIFHQHKISVINVAKRSVEETAAEIIKRYERHKLK